ncbi:hypothetical protein TWF481_001022 [Arthrobotrys musiformis]|uniref:HNH nuclease domain-containing protein n=1 Tax=Arthrobotrys musiformis TaxID=47236 RepID=A0AAV9WPB2_9PEZI
MSSPNAGDESVLTRELKYELAGLLTLRDKLPQPGGACVICSDHKSKFRVSFIIREEDEALFETYKKSGYIPDPLSKLDDIENLLPTCPNCASLFDTPRPSILLLPQNLDFFILWEHRDYERRTQEFNKSNVSSERTVPEYDDYNGSYKLYVLTNDPETIHEGLRIKIEDGERRIYTEASPTALILHAGRAMGIPEVHPRGYGIPIHIRQKLVELFNLWERLPPGEHSAPSTPEEYSMIKAGSSPMPSKSRKKNKKAKGKGKGKGKRVRSPSSPDTSNDSYKSTTRTPKSKRVKMRDLTRGDDKERRKAQAEGRFYVSPASPEKSVGSERGYLRTSLRGSVSFPVLTFGGRKRGDVNRIGLKKLSGGGGKMRNKNFDYDEEEEEEDEDVEDSEDSEGGESDDDSEDGEDGESEEDSEDGESQEDESDESDDSTERRKYNWSFGPRMSSSDIIESALGSSKRYS